MSLHLNLATIIAFQHTLTHTQTHTNRHTHTHTHTHTHIDTLIHTHTLTHNTVVSDGEGNDHSRNEENEDEVATKFGSPKSNLSNILDIVLLI